MWIPIKRILFVWTSILVVVSCLPGGLQDAGAAKAPEADTATAHLLWTLYAAIVPVWQSCIKTLLLRKIENFSLFLKFFNGPWFSWLFLSRLKCFKGFYLFFCFYSCYKENGVAINCVCTGNSCARSVFIKCHQQCTLPLITLRSASIKQLLLISLATFPLPFISFGIVGRTGF